MPFVTPPSSKGQVRRAGLAVADGTATSDDYALVDRWRASHGYVINTFQLFFRRKIHGNSLEIEFAQRLKRRNTVIGKLRRRNPDGRPLVSDVTSMHDFAGCRMIFDGLDDLMKFRRYIHSTAVMRNVDHKLRHDADKYNYISHPKASGYRGIHDVYQHYPRGSKRTEASKPWDGLSVEIQYRRCCTT
jgi:ppGpp synthetase/RelA/SpoT-type nucleotidyltranferase